MSQSKRGLEKQPDRVSSYCLPKCLWVRAKCSRWSHLVICKHYHTDSYFVYIDGLTWWYLPEQNCYLSSIDAETQAEPPPQFKRFKREIKASFPQDAPPPTTEDSTHDVRTASEWPPWCIPACLCCNLPFQLLLLFYKLPPKLSCLKQPFCYAYQIQLVRNLGRAH